MGAPLLRIPRWSKERVLLGNLRPDMFRSQSCSKRQTRSQPKPRPWGRHWPRHSRKSYVDSENYESGAASVLESEDTIQREGDVRIRDKYQWHSHHIQRCQDRGEWTNASRLRLKTEIPEPPCVNESSGGRNSSMADSECSCFG